MVTQVTPYTTRIVNAVPRNLITFNALSKSTPSSAGTAIFFLHPVMLFSL